jgi:DNA-binding IclR family transcriptional regulator
VPVAVSHQGKVATQSVADRSLRTETPESSAQRLLDVLEGVCRFGPITLSDLVSRLDIPRGAVWRSLDALRQKGWVRMRHGDRAFELCAAVTGLFAHAHAARPEVEALMPIFTRLADSGPVHVDLGLFTARGTFRVVETTRKQGYADQSLSLTDEDIALAAQLHLPPADLVRHLTTFMERAGTEERQVISSGEHARTIRRLRQHGVVWHDDGSSASLGRRGWPGVALRVELWRYSRIRAEGLRELVTEIVATEVE